MSKHQKHMVNTEGDRDPECGVKAEVDSLGNTRSRFLASHFFLFHATPKSSIYSKLSTAGAGAPMGQTFRRESNHFKTFTHADQNGNHFQIKYKGSICFCLLKTRIKGQAGGVKG